MRRRAHPSDGRLFFSLVFLLFAVAGNAAAAVEPMGAFRRLTGPKNAADGYQLLLWRDGGTLLGRFTVWQSGEAQSGDFSNGLIDAKGVYVLVKLAADEDSPSARPLEVGLKGTVAGNRFDGLLFWNADRARVGDDDSAEKISLPVYKAIKLRPFKNLDAWRRAAEKTE